jgi:hypothetical protein
VNACFHSPYVTSSLARGWVCRLQLLLALASGVILRSKSRGTSDHILLTQIRDSSNLEGQVPVFISPSYRVAPLYTQALGSLFVASYDSQSWGGGIRPACTRDIQPGGPGPRIYIPQKEGGSVISPGIGLPFRRLLRLTGLLCTDRTKTSSPTIPPLLLAYPLPRKIV